MNTRLVGNICAGSIAAILTSFLPVLNFVFGGGVSGYLTAGDLRRGATAGAVAALPAGVITALSGIEWAVTAAVGPVLFALLGAIVASSCGAVGGFLGSIIGAEQSGG